MDNVDLDSLPIKVFVDTIAVVDRAASVGTHFTALAYEPAVIVRTFHTIPVGNLVLASIPFCAYIQAFDLNAVIAPICRICPRGHG